MADRIRKLGMPNAEDEMKPKSEAWVPVFPSSSAQRRKGKQSWEG